MLLFSFLLAMSLLAAPIPVNLRKAFVTTLALLNGIPSTAGPASIQKAISPIMHSSSAALTHVAPALGHQVQSLHQMPAFSATRHYTAKEIARLDALLDPAANLPVRTWVLYLLIPGTMAVRKTSYTFFYRCCSSFGFF